MTTIPDTLEQLRVPVSSLKPYGRNPRRGDIKAIAESLRRHGQYRPIVVNARTQEVLAGNHTLAAARELGWDEIAATFVDVDDDQAARIVLVDNRANDIAGYDDPLLAQLLGGLPDLEGTGYAPEDLDELLASLQPPNSAGPGGDTAPSDAPTAPRTKPGDVYHLGDHRLACGDATDITTVDGLLGHGETVDLVFTDPPYGVAVSGAGGASISGDLGNVAITGFFPLAIAHLKTGRAIYLCGGASNVPLYFKLYELNCRQLPVVLVWVKEQFVLRHHDYHAQCEFIYYGWKPGGRPEDRWYADRKQSDVWRFDRDPRAEYEHPTQKPVVLPETAIANSSPPEALVYEPFAGSGSTLIACENLGRRCRALEIDPGYCDVIVDRWERHTGGTANLVRDGDGG